MVILNTLQLASLRLVSYGHLHWSFQYFFLLLAYNLLEFSLSFHGLWWIPNVYNFNKKNMSERRKETSSCQAQTVILPTKTVHNKTINLLAILFHVCNNVCSVHIWFLPNLLKNTFCCSLCCYYFIEKTVAIFLYLVPVKMCDGFMFIFFYIFFRSLLFAFALIPRKTHSMKCCMRMEWMNLNEVANVLKFQIVFPRYLSLSLSFLSVSRDCSGSFNLKA